LKKEKSLQADLAIKYSWKQNSIQLNYYYARVQHFMIGKINPSYSTMTIGANGVKTYSNLSYASISGAELIGLFKPIDFVVFEGDSSPNQPVYKVAEAMQKNMLVYVGSDECEVVGYYYSDEHQAMVLELEIKENP
jgi:iron complex outermembrane receptor protein